MTNLGYIVAAYTITLGALALYGLYLWNRLRRLETRLAATTFAERPAHGRR
jgi:hypothetical protein